MQSKTPFIVISIVLIILAFGGGYFLSQKMGGSVTSIGTSNNSIFTQQSAMISGQVTKVSGRNLTIKANNGQTATFPAAQQTFINNVKTLPAGTTNAPIPTPETNLSAIEINRPSTIVLTMNNGRYEVTAITTIPAQNITTPLTTKAATSSANN